MMVEVNEQKLLYYFDLKNKYYLKDLFDLFLVNQNKKNPVLKK
jgi:hypothetical protein